VLKEKKTKYALNKQRLKDALDAEAKDILDYAGKHKIVPTTIDSVNKAVLILC
jgi:hypothetical protein